MRTKKKFKINKWLVRYIFASTLTKLYFIFSSESDLEIVGLTLFVFTFFEVLGICLFKKYLKMERKK